MASSVSRGREHHTCVRTRTCPELCAGSLFFSPLYASLDAPAAAAGSALPQKHPSSFWGELCYVRLILLLPDASHPRASDADAAPACCLGTNTHSCSTKRAFLSLLSSLFSLPFSLSLPLPGLSVSLVSSLVSRICPSLSLCPSVLDLVFLRPGNTLTKQAGSSSLNVIQSAIGNRHVGNSRGYATRKFAHFG